MNYIVFRYCPMAWKGCSSIAKSNQILKAFERFSLNVHTKIGKSIINYEHVFYRWLYTIWSGLYASKLCIYAITHLIMQQVVSHI